jgi:outer membrane lipoprotein-sorting protein
VLRLIVDEFWRIQRERVSEYELADAKAYLTGSFPLTIETPEAIAMQVVNVLFYGLPLDELQTFRERVNAVTVDDIQRVAQKYLRPDRLSVVLVGNASAFASQLRGVGFDKFETIELGDLDLTEANFKRAGTRAGRAGGAGWSRGSRGSDRSGWSGGSGGWREGARPAYAQQQQATAAPKEVETAEQLLDRAIAAKGGLEKLRAINTIVVKQTLVTQAPQGETRVETTNYIQYPDRFRIETQTPNGPVLQGYDGVQAWVKSQGRVYEAPEAQAREAKAGLRREIVSLLLAAKDGVVKARLVPDRKGPDGRVSRALEISNPDLNPVVLYIDPASGLVTEETYVSDTPGRPLVADTFSDYRAIDGVQIAFAAARKVGPVTVERHVTDVKINTPLDASLFKRPAS